MYRTKLSRTEDLVEGGRCGRPPPSFGGGRAAGFSNIVELSLLLGRQQVEQGCKGQAALFEQGAHTLLACRGQKKGDRAAISAGPALHQALRLKRADLAAITAGIVDDDGGPVGVAYYAPERLTAGTWNIYLIGVHPDRQGQGAARLRSIEKALALRGERMVLVETLGLPSFAGQRAFYRRCGYEEEARIRDFYDAGADKVVFRKLLSSASNGN